MKAIMIMYDSLNRLFLPCYGDRETIAPNFERLAEHTICFDRFYAGSLPCMPARRELHTGRYNFLHRVWGPLEPFDDSVPEILGRNGVYSHCVTDHAHYWQDGGVGFLNRFVTYEMIRGQEGDTWAGNAADFTHSYDLKRQDVINREHMPDEESHSHVQTFKAGMKFLEENVDNDNWYLQIEYFDPHEPYFVPERFKKLYTDREENFDWPYYGEVDNEDEIRQARNNYRAVVSMIDEYLGKILDFMDAHDMWKDTMLIVNTDHGYMLGEHGFFGKNYMPTYEQISHTPFFLWHPEIGKCGERIAELAQTIDIGPTILDAFHIEPTERMLGKSLLPVAADNRKIHDCVLFGYFGKHVNITDGRYVYMRSGRSAEEGLLNNYTLVPYHMFWPMTKEELRKTDLKLKNDFRFTDGVPVMKIPATDENSPHNTCYMYSEHMKYGDLLFDLETDPSQDSTVVNEKVTASLTEKMRCLLTENEAPDELFKRLDLSKEG